MKRLKTVIIWVLLLSLFGIAVCVAGKLGDRAEDVTASSFMSMIESGDITKVTFTGSDMVGERSGDRPRVKARLQEQSHVIASLEAQDIPYSDTEPPNYTFWIYFIIIAVIIAATVLPLIFFMKMLKGGPAGRAESFGQHKAVRVEKKTGKTFADVAGCQEAKAEAYDIVDFLKNPDRFKRRGAKMPRGYLLEGPSGTGKTLLAKAIAGEAGVPFFAVSGSDFVEMFVGVGAARVRDLIDAAKKYACAIIFIDEIDAVSEKRGGATGSGGDTERLQTLNALLNGMDGIQDENEFSGIIFVAATNRPESLDPALLRPGRFTRRILVPRPDRNGRKQILELYAQRVPMDASVDLAEVAKMTPGMTGAGLEQLINEAAIVAAKQDADAVTMEMLVRCILRVRLGAPRKSMILSAKDLWWTAVHEVGHVIAGWFNPHGDTVDKVTCIPHGPALGVTLFVSDEEIHTYSREYLQAAIERGLGGYVAEDLMFKTTSSGVRGDMHGVTDVAEAMVMQYGMADAVGTRAFNARGGGHLDYDLTRRVYSEEAAARVDRAIDQILRDRLEAVKERIAAKQDKLEELAKMLVEQETLDTDQIESVLGPRPTVEQGA